MNRTKLHRKKLTLAGEVIAQLANDDLKTAVGGSEISGNGGCDTTHRPTVVSQRCPR